MKDKRILIILAALALVIIVAVRQFSHRPVPPEPQTVLTSPTPTQAVERPKPQESTTNYQPVPIDTEPFPGGASITGKIAAVDGRVIAGAEVYLCERLPAIGTSGLFLLPLPRAGEAFKATTTDASGEYRFESIHPGSYMVTARSTEYAQNGREVIGLGDEEQRGEVDLLLFPAKSIKGIVVDSEGFPVRKAKVEAIPEEKTFRLGGPQWNDFDPVYSDDAGRFSHNYLLPGSYRLEVSARGFAPLQRDGVMTGGNDLRLVLQPGLSIWGEVVDEQGWGIAGAEIQVRQKPKQVSLMTQPPRLLLNPPLQADRDGKFSLDGIPIPTSDSPVTLLVVARDYNCVEWKVPHDWQPDEEGNRSVQITLQRGATLRGQVVDRFNNPVVGAILKVVQVSGGGYPPWKNFYTNRRGRFEVYGIPAGSVDLQVEASGFSMQRIKAEAPGEPLTIVLQAAGAILGRVVRKDHPAAGVEGAYVTAMAAEGGMLQAETQKSGPDGLFAFESLMPGDYQLRASASRVPGLDKVTVHLEPGEVVNGIELPMIVRGGIWARILDAVSRKPVAKADVIAETTQARRQQKSDASGYVFFESLPPGTWSLGVFADGYIPVPSRSETSPNLEVTGEETDEVFEILLEKGATVHGQLLNTEGEPIEGVYVMSVSPDDSAPGFPTVHTQSNRQGKFVLANVAPDRDFILLAKRRWCADSRTGPYRVEKGETLWLEPITLVRTGRLRGRLVNSEGEGLVGQLLLDDQIVSSRADGTFTIIGQEGLRTLRAEVKGYRPQSRAVRINTGPTNETLEVRLDALPSD